MVRMAEEMLEKPGSRKWWMPYLWIVLASAAAHLWCLGSQFYFDDMVIIRDNESIRAGVIGGGISNKWTNLWYVLQYKLFGTSAVGYHAVNWLLHTATACALFSLGRKLLKDRGGDGVAWFAALLFVVHPLASEIPNYARTQDLAWVTLFSLLACRALAGFLTDGRVLWLAGVVLAFAGALLSKGPGMFHALMMMAAVGFLMFRKERWGRWKLQVAGIVGVACVGATILWFSGFLPNLLSRTDAWSGPRFIGHAYTLSRVFWEFAWRSIIPVGLCSDHQIAETVVLPGMGWLDVTDGVAKWSAAGMLGLAALSLGLCWMRSTRVFGVCLLLFVATILFRVTYVVPEFMPEYRIYPGLPWFCLGASVLFTALWKLLPGEGSPRIFAILILLPCIVLSARRSMVWHDLRGSLWRRVETVSGAGQGGVGTP